MEQTQLTRPYALLHGFFWMCWASVMGFASVDLLSRGFGSNVVGMIIAVSGILSALIQPVIAGYADRPGSRPIRTILAVGAVVLVAAAIGLIICSGSVLPVVLYGIAMAMLQTMNPFLNALGVEAAGSGCRCNFGVARGIGSIAYAALSYSLGSLADTFGSMVVVWSIFFAAGVLLFLLCRFPVRQRPKQPAEKTVQADSHGFFRKYPRYGLVLVGCILLFIGHTVLNNFTFQVVQSKGGGSSEMGTAMAIAALLELIPMFALSLFLRIAPCHSWIRFCGVFFTAKIFITLAAPNVFWFFLAQPFQILGWGIIAVCSVFYVDSIMLPQDRTKGQAFYTMSFTIGTVLGAVIGGDLIQRFNVDTALMVGTVFSVFGSLFLILFTEKPKANS